MNSFAQVLNSGRLIVTAECLPPRGTDPAAMERFSSALPDGLDAVIVADNPDQIRSSALSAARLLVREGRSSVVLSMATRDRNRIALISDAMGAAALDIPAVLCMSGNHQSRGICPQAASANDLDSIQLTQSLKRIVLYGSDTNGRKLEPGVDLQVGATAHPYLRPTGLSLSRLKKKIVAGADFLVTQAIFDMEQFGLWMQEVRSAGLDNRTAIIASVLPLESVSAAKQFQESELYGPIPDWVVERIGKADDEAMEGVAIASEIAGRLKDIPGVRGIHILSAGRESLVGDVFARAGLDSGSRPQK